MAQRTSTRVAFCTQASIASGEHVPGSAWACNRYFAVEVPLPWPYNMLESRGMPGGMQQYITELYERGVYWGWLAIAPDPEYSVPGTTRVIEFSAPPSPPYRSYARRELLFPDDNFASLIRLLGDTPGAPGLRHYEQPDDGMRDLFVCTHGTVDICCATYGYPFYQLLRHAAPGAPSPTRAWRCTHFGGHRFAATLLDMPEGRYWGRLEARHIGPFLRRDPRAMDVWDAYRGWSMLPSYVDQIAEAELRQALDWSIAEWEVTPPEGTPLDRLPEAFDLVFGLCHLPSGRSGRVTIHLEPTRILAVASESNSATTDDFQQYDAGVVAIDPPDLLETKG